MRPYLKHPWRPAMPATRAAGNAWPASSPSRLPALVEGQYQCTAQRRRVRRVVGIGQRVDHRRRAGIEERRIGVSEVDGGEVHARIVEEADKPGQVIADVEVEGLPEIGRASCKERVCQYDEILVVAV